MSNITMTKAQPVGSRGAAAGSPRQANTLLAFALAGAVAIAPLPFGSVRPIYWGVWAIYIGVVGLVYFAALLLRGQGLRVTPQKLWPAIILSILTCAYLVVQLAPLGGWTLPVDGPLILSAPQISIAPDMTALMLMRQLAYLVFVALLMQVAINDNRRARLLQALGVVVLVYGAYGVVSLQTGDTILGMQKWAYVGSATGPFVNRNSFATFLGLGAIIALAQGCALIVRQSERHAHDGRIPNLASGIILHGLAYLFLLSVIVATQSRMGLIATVTGSGLVVAITLLTIGRMRLAILALPALLILLAIALGLFGEGLLERLGGADESTGSRIALYQQVIDLIALRPWTGFGGGSFELAFPLVHQVPVSPDFGWSRAHSTYLTLWAELGLIFGSLPILVIAYLGWRMIGGIIGKTGSWTAQVIGLGAIAVAGLHSLVDFSLEIPAVTLLFLSLVSIGAATTTPTRDKAKV